ncbi:MAG: DNA polymerase IV [Anaerolineae bacterium]|nr:DNA polymerase IV [Anaerolineae bacterium]
MIRKIIHLDLDAFFCAVEEQRDPTLRGKPFVVGGKSEYRGVVSSASYPARRYGIHSAMPTARAMQRCPDLIIVSGRHHQYSEMSRKVMQHLYNRTNLVEQISIDEAFLDVTDLRTSAEILARDLQSDIWDDLLLPCSLGVATNKLVAKIANNVGKSSAQTDGPPMAIKVIPPGQEAAFLAPLPVKELWGVGPKTADSFARLGIKTIGDIARWPPQDLIARFGQHGEDLANRARGLDSRPIMTEHEAKSISQETTFAQDVSDAGKLQRTLLQLVENVGWRLRQAEVVGSTIRIKLRWADFTTITRQITLAVPTNQDGEILQAAQSLFTKTWLPGKPVRLLGVGVSGFQSPAQQLELWETPSQRGERLQKALDEVRDRYGKRAIHRAIDLNSSRSDEKKEEKTG